MYKQHFEIQQKGYVKQHIPSRDDSETNQILQTSKQNNAASFVFSSFLFPLKAATQPNICSQTNVQSTYSCLLFMQAQVLFFLVSPHYV